MARPTWHLPPMIGSPQAGTRQLQPDGRLRSHRRTGVAPVSIQKLSPTIR